jgi:hypothetical protein
MGRLNQTRGGKNTMTAAGYQLLTLLAAAF